MGVGPICAVLTGRAAVSRPPAPKASHAVGLLGDSSTVEQRTLTPLILVRIQVPQPTQKGLDRQGLALLFSPGV